MAQDFSQRQSNSPRCSKGWINNPNRDWSQRKTWPEIGPEPKTEHKYHHRCCCSSRWSWSWNHSLIWAWSQTCGSKWVQSQSCNAVLNQRQRCGWRGGQGQSHSLIWGWSWSSSQNTWQSHNSFPSRARAKVVLWYQADGKVAAWDGTRATVAGWAGANINIRPEIKSQPNMGPEPNLQSDIMLEPKWQPKMGRQIFGLSNGWSQSCRWSCSWRQSLGPNRDRVTAASWRGARAKTATWAMARAKAVAKDGAGGKLQSKMGPSKNLGQYWARPSVAARGGPELKFLPQELKSHCNILTKLKSQL